MAIFNSFLYVYQRVSICIIYLISKFHRGKKSGHPPPRGWPRRLLRGPGHLNVWNQAQKGTTGTMDGYGSHENYGWLVVYGNILLILMVNINGYHMVNDGFP